MWNKQTKGTQTHREMGMVFMLFQSVVLSMAPIGLLDGELSHQRNWQLTKSNKSWMISYQVSDFILIHSLLFTHCDKTIIVVIWWLKRHFLIFLIECKLNWWILQNPKFTPTLTKNSTNARNANKHMKQVKNFHLKWAV